MDAVDEAHPLRVVIAGGGIGGLLLANALSKLKTCNVVVLEKASRFSRFGGPIQLASNALSVIRRVDEDLFDNLIAALTFIRINGLVDGLRGEWYCRFDVMEWCADTMGLLYTGVVDRPDLQDALVAPLPEGMLLHSKEVTGYKILPRGGGVCVQCEDGTDILGDVLIGADGIWSATRAQMWGEARRGAGSGCTYSGYVVFSGEASRSADEKFEVGYKVFFGLKNYFVCSDVGGGRIQWYAFCSMPEDVEIPVHGATRKSQLLSHFEGWSPQILDLIASSPVDCVDVRVLYDRPPSVCKSWGEGPVALLGDACHPMMPNLGQGGCQAMEDAYVIAEKLRALRRRSEVPEALQDYYRSRLVRSAVVQGISRFSSELLRSAFTFPWKPSEGFSAPHGLGRGDLNVPALIVHYLRYLLPGFFATQFLYLYSFRPFRWSSEEVREAMERAGKVWQRQEAKSL